MNHNIIPSLTHLAEPIEKLKPLPGNPHKGAVEEMKVVLAEFGQHRPVVAQGTSEEGGFSLVGNTMTSAAKALGWTHIAVAWVQEDNARAMARALSDNHVATLGVDDPRLMNQALELALTEEEHYVLFEGIGIDDFELAALAEASTRERESGYLPPVLLDRPSNPVVEGDTPAPDRRGEGGLPGSPLPGAPPAGERPERPERRAVVQYSLVFDDNDQQKRWHDFIRHLRSDAEVTDYDTTSAKLMAWLEARADF